MESIQTLTQIEMDLVAQARPSAPMFPKDFWADRIASIPSNVQELEVHEKQVEALKKQVVEGHLMDPSSGPMERIKLINLLTRLGVSYHFQAEIEDHLHRIFHSQPFDDNQDYDLNTVAIAFRVFREHGYKMSSDVFERFKDAKNGTFKESLAQDTEGLLNLYEATHLRTHGEHNLEEALAFTRAQLLALQSELLPNYVANHIKTSLENPLYRGVQRIKAREFIHFYEKYRQCDDDLGSEMLLKFAKLDYNRVQLLYQQELKNHYKWWKDIDMESKLPYSRYGIMGFCFWSIGIYFEPCYAYGREVYVKVCHLLTKLDDTYDSYAPLEDLRIFTNALERWDRKVIDELPKDYMKHLYRAFLDLFDDLDDRATEEGRSFAVSITKDLVVEFAKAYLIESEWTASGHTPSFEESVEKVGVVSSGGRLLISLAMVGMGEIAGRDAYEWLLLHGQDMVRAAGLVARFTNDVASFKREEESGFATNPFTSYKREYQLSEAEALEQFRGKITSLWMTVTEGLMKQPRTVPMEVLTRALNLARSMEETYKDGDGVTYGKHLEDHNKTLFIDPIPI